VAALNHNGEPTVYLLDDDSAVRQSVNSVARSLQLPVEIFATAGDFLKQFNPSRPGCIVTEARLPGMGGVELLEKIHRAGAFYAAIVVAAKADVSSAVRAMRAGAVTFLEKPCDDQQIWNSLHEALKRDADHRQRQALVDRIRRRMEKLNEGESQVLPLVLEGKKNHEIAASLKVHCRTVEERRARIMEKMKASSLADLLREAITLDILQAAFPSLRAKEPSADDTAPGQR
jgi:RNA polymerase sigma factor (sigma-70 family)